ncbi:MAG: two-component system sensor histidine kinase NtrB [Planctomycetota bacterium]
MLVCVAAEIFLGFTQFREAGDSRAMQLSIVGATAFAVVATGGTGLLLFRMSVRHGRLESEKLVAAEMARTARLAEIGRLAAGVAHEIHNPLQGVNGYLALLDRENVDFDKRRAHVAAIRGALQKIERLTRDLLDYANPAAPHRVAIAPYDLYQNLERSLAADPRFQQIERIIHVDPGVPSAFADASAMERVLLNLSLNASDAMGGKGKIYLSARRTPEGAVELEVSDEGPGVSNDMRKHLFEPFRSGRGSTGLGLWICENLVRANGGTIRHESYTNIENRSAAGGARFIITLPPNR